MTYCVRFIGNKMQVYGIEMELSQGIPMGRSLSIDYELTKEVLNPEKVKVSLL